MSEAYIGQIKLFGFNYAPKSWALCQGQILPIKQNEALYSLLGTLYGGDGQSTFGLPDMGGRTPFQFNSQYVQGVAGAGGEEAHTLIVNEMPAHNHLMVTDGSSSDSGTLSSPASAEVLGAASGVTQPSGTFGVTLYATATPTGTLDSSAIAPTGGGDPHNNLMPYLVLNYSIALSGLYPSKG